MQPSSPSHAPAEQSNNQQPNMHSMVVLQPGEQIFGTVKRHPFGILSLYVGSTIGILVAAVLGFVLLPQISSQFSSGAITNYVYIGLALIVGGIVLMLALVTRVYWQNQWVITSDSITQITQTSIFGRQVSQLSMENLEDVTVDQHGILPHMFKYGTLRCQTAGENSKFAFSYCPNPSYWARTILDVHEKYLNEQRSVRLQQPYAAHSAPQSAPPH